LKLFVDDGTDWQLIAFLAAVQVVVAIAL